MEIKFTGKIWYWRGPSPFYFVTVPEKQGNALKGVMKIVTYGWGMIPAEVQIGKTKWTTAMFPKNGSYIVPIKAMLRKAEDLEEGSEVTVRLKIS